MDTRRNGKLMAEIYKTEDEMVKGVMEQYVAWLNGWAGNAEGTGDPGWRYTLADFSDTKVMVKGDREEDEETEHGGYGWTRIGTKVGLPGDETWLWIMDVYDGDEGGPAQLTIWWERESEAVYDKEYYDIEYVKNWTDEDSYDEKERKGGYYVWRQGVKIDGVLMAGVKTEAPKYLGDKYLGWRLGTIVQTFDTDRTFVYNGKLCKGWEQSD